MFQFVFVHGIEACGVNDNLVLEETQAALSWSSLTENGGRVAGLLEFFLFDSDHVILLLSLYRQEIVNGI